MTQPDGTTIDITRPYEILAFCPECDLRCRLPEDWQRLVAPGMPPDWDGEIRCARHAAPVIMVTVPIRHPRIEADGSVIVHLVMDSDHRRAACTEQLWAGVPDNLPAGRLLRQCQACAAMARRG